MPSNVTLFNVSSGSLPYRLNQWIDSSTKTSTRIRKRSTAIDESLLGGECSMLTVWGEISRSRRNEPRPRPTNSIGDTCKPAISLDLSLLSRFAQPLESIRERLGLRSELSVAVFHQRTLELFLRSGTVQV